MGGRIQRGRWRRLSPGRLRDQYEDIHRRLGGGGPAQTSLNYLHRFACLANDDGSADLQGLNGTWEGSKRAERAWVTMQAEGQWRGKHLALVRRRLGLALACVAESLVSIVNPSARGHGALSQPTAGAVQSVPWVALAASSLLCFALCGLRPHGPTNEPSICMAVCHSGCAAWVPPTDTTVCCTASSTRWPAIYRVSPSFTCKKWPCFWTIWSLMPTRMWRRAALIGGCPSPAIEQQWALLRLLTPQDWLHRLGSVCTGPMSLEHFKRLVRYTQLLQNRAGAVHPALCSPQSSAPCRRGRGHTHPHPRCRWSARVPPPLRWAAGTDHHQQWRSLGGPTAT